MRTAIVTLCAVLMAGGALAEGTAGGGRGGGASGGSAGAAAAGSTGSGAASVDTTGSGAAAVDRAGSDADDIDAVAGSIGTGEVDGGVVTAPDVSGVPLVEGEQAPGAGAPLVGRAAPALDGQAGAADNAGRATQPEAQAPVVVDGGQAVIVLPPRDGLTQSGNANLQQMTEGVGGDVEPQTRRPGQE